MYSEYVRREVADILKNYNQNERIEFRNSRVG